MALELMLDSLDGVDESISKMYEKGTDGKFNLKKDFLPVGFEDIQGLRTNRDKILGEKKSLQAKLDEIDAAAKKAKEEAEEALRKALKEKGNTEDLDKSWTEKYNKGLAAKDGEISALNKEIYELTVNKKAMEIAGKLAKEAKYIPALLPHIKGRLTNEVVDGKRVLKVLDENGSVSALTPDEFTEHLKTVEHLQPLIIGSSASGGGARNDGGAGGNKPLYRDSMTPSEKAEYITKNGDEAFYKLPKSKK